MTSAPRIFGPAHYRVGSVSILVENDVLGKIVAGLVVAGRDDLALKTCGKLMQVRDVAVYDQKSVIRDKGREFVERMSDIA